MSFQIQVDLYQPLPIELSWPLWVSTLLNSFSQGAHRESHVNDLQLITKANQ